MSFQQKKKRPDWNSLMAGCAGFTPPATAERERRGWKCWGLCLCRCCCLFCRSFWRGGQRSWPVQDQGHVRLLVMISRLGRSRHLQDIWIPRTKNKIGMHQIVPRPCGCHSGALCSLFKGTSERCVMLCCLLTVVWETSTWWQHRHFIHCLTVSDFCQEMSPKFDRSVANMKGFAPPPNGL